MEETSIESPRKRQYSITSSGVSLHWRKKYVDEAEHFWDEFYKRNTTNFYKDRYDQRASYCSVRATKNVEITLEEQVPLCRHWLGSAEKDGFEYLLSGAKQEVGRLYFNTTHYKVWWICTHR